jgi:hypothetical protein
MKRVGFVAFMGLGVGMCPAQSVAIPLNYAVDTGYSYGTPDSSRNLFLTINVGVNGGAAQAYAFDRGSAVFLAPDSVLAGGASSQLRSGVANVETYGTGTGAQFSAQAYGGQSVTDVRSELGIRTDKSYAVQNGVLTLRGRLAWAHDFDPDRSVSATFLSLPGASFVVNGAA